MDMETNQSSYVLLFKKKCFYSAAGHVSIDGTFDTGLLEIRQQLIHSCNDNEASSLDLRTYAAQPLTFKARVDRVDFVPDYPYARQLFSSWGQLWIRSDDTVEQLRAPGDVTEALRHILHHARDDTGCDAAAVCIAVIQDDP